MARGKKKTEKEQLISLPIKYIILKQRRASIYDLQDTLSDEYTNNMQAIRTLELNSELNIFKIKRLKLTQNMLREEYNSL